MPGGWWDGWTRYVHLYRAFGRYCLIREMSFRVNFLVRCFTELAWMGMLLVFFHLIFLRTERIGDWDQYAYLIFLGTGFLLNGIVNVLFLDNCANFSELIRTGDLDFTLLKPIDEQFVVTCQRIDWASMGTVLLGIALVVIGAAQSGVPMTWSRGISFSLLILTGVAVLYSLMLMVASSSVWIVRNSGLYEAWFYVAQFARYPSEIYAGGTLGIALRFALTFILPILLAVNMPARVGAEMSTEGMIPYFVAVSIVFLVISRWFFRFALTRYRSASS